MKVKGYQIFRLVFTGWGLGFISYFVINIYFALGWTFAYSLCWFYSIIFNEIEKGSHIHNYTNLGDRK